MTYADPKQESTVPEGGPGHAPSVREHSVLDTIAGIKDGRIDPKLLEEEDRRACVQYLASEGATIPEIAKLLKRSDRTIQRDRDAIRAAAALQHDPKFAERMAGLLVGEAELATERIRRVTRSAETPPAVKVEGEHRCYQIRSDLVTRLQSLGLMPTAAHRVEADLTHRRSLDVTQAAGEVRRIAAVAIELLPADDPLRVQIAGLAEAASTEAPSSDPGDPSTR
jgi:hypothetical protein